MKELFQISFSGGRTSGYMTKKLLDNYSDQYDFIVTFANTGREHPKTLEFVNNCDRVFGFNTVWLEAVTHKSRKACTHKIITFETACRDGSVFEDAIKKYGVPNQSYPWCTRELKLSVMTSYLKSRGIALKEIKTAVGIRNDESRRVSKKAKDTNIVYPLIDMFPTDKIQVLDWWKRQEFDLDLEEFEGNCIGCFKKSLKKQFMQIDKDPLGFLWNSRMEAKYTGVAAKHGDRVFFRGNLDTEGLFQLYRETKEAQTPTEAMPDANGGCSESCELYDMEG